MNIYHHDNLLVNFFFTILQAKIKILAFTKVKNKSSGKINVIIYLI